jgi:uncharacterized protein YggE
LKHFLFIVFLLGHTTTSMAQDRSPMIGTWPVPETVSVTGTGKTTLTPDRFTFTSGVQTVAPTVEDAVNQNNARVASVVAALKKAGATDREIRTSNFAIWPQQDYSQGKLPRILGYQVSNDVTVTTDKIDMAGKLLQVAIAAGVNHTSGLVFQVSDPTRGRDQGMKAAFDDAKAKASVLAQAAGRALGKTIWMSEGAGEVIRPPIPMQRSAMVGRAEGAISDVPVESGTQEMTFAVSVMFELR